MNAIISLCHFCEVHGPRMVYSTQPFRPQEPKESGIENSENGIPYLRSSSVSSSDHSSFPSASHSTNLCEGCSSSHQDFVSHDVDAKVSYVSTQSISNPEVFSRIRQACIRSLSCEVCPGREGPIFYGDEQCGQVLSYTFYISDTQARGLKRWYSILVIMMDKIYLLNSWPFLVQNIRLIIDNLQNKAQKVFDLEEEKCPQRPYRMQSVVDPTNFMKKRGGGNKTTRSLQELTADKNLFCMLHSAFIWLLRVCGNKTKETLLEGPPTEDSIIDLENQTETEEGFVVINTRKVLDRDLRTVGGDAGSSSMGSEVNTNIGDDGSDDTTELPTDHSSDCDEILEDTNLEGPRVKSLRHLRKCMGSSDFQTLAHHIIIGNQVVIRSSFPSLVHSVIHLLKCFLPKGSCRIPNLFMMIPPDANISNFKVNTNHIVLEISTKVVESTTTSSLASNDTLDSSDFTELEDETLMDLDLYQNYRFSINSPTSLSHRVPTVLHRMLMTLANGNLGKEVVDACFTCLKEEWMNKVKVHYTFTQSTVKRSDDDKKKLLQMLGAREEDRKLLDFWMTGLSVRYRTHVMSTSSHSHR